MKSQILVEIARKNDEKAEGYWYYLEHFEEVFRAIYEKYGVSLLQGDLLLISSALKQTSTPLLTTIQLLLKSAARQCQPELIYR